MDHHRLVRWSNIRYMKCGSMFLNWIYVCGLKLDLCGLKMDIHTSDITTQIGCHSAPEYNSFGESNPEIGDEMALHYYDLYSVYSCSFKCICIQVSLHALCCACTC
eukprot:851366_1